MRKTLPDHLRFLFCFLFGHKHYDFDHDNKYCNNQRWVQAIRYDALKDENDSLRAEVAALRDGLNLVDKTLACSPATEYVSAVSYAFKLIDNYLEQAKAIRDEREK